MRAPCRVCTAEGFKPTDHSVFKCSRKPPTDKRSTEPPAKKIKFSVMEQINSMTASQYNEMEKTLQQVKAVRALITNGEELGEEGQPAMAMMVRSGQVRSGQVYYSAEV